MASDDGVGAARLARCSSLIVSHKNSPQIEMRTRRWSIAEATLQQASGR